MAFYYIVSTYNSQVIQLVDMGLLTHWAQWCLHVFVFIITERGI